MKTFLLDTSSLIVLIDSTHIFHERAKSWFLSIGRKRWATCPIVEAGAMRIVLNPGYSNPQTNAQTVVTTLGLLKSSYQKGYSFWSDDLSITDTEVFRWEKIHGHKQITDVYLLGLCQRNNGKLATFDRKLTTRAIAGADSKIIEVIEDG